MSLEELLTVIDWDLLGGFVCVGCAVGCLIEFYASVSPGWIVGSIFFGLTAIGIFIAG